MSAMKILKAGALYFAFVFGSGFAMGPVRIFWLAPKVGERTAELIEEPIMLAVVYFSARWIVKRFAMPPAPGPRLAVGCTGLALLLAAEFSLVLGLRGLTLADYFAQRDPVAGAVYYAMLGVFALMPFLLARLPPALKGDP